MPIWSEIKAILTAPLAEKLDPVQLFLIVGLVLVFVSAWIILLGYMDTGISAIAEEI